MPRSFFPIQVKAFPHVPWLTYNTGNSIFPESIFPAPAWLGCLSPKLLAGGGVQPVLAFIPKYDCMFMVQFLPLLLVQCLLTARVILQGVGWYSTGVMCCHAH